MGKLYRCTFGAAAGVGNCGGVTKFYSAMGTMLLAALAGGLVERIP